MVAGSARGALSGRIPLLAQPAPRRCATRLRADRWTATFAAVIDGLRRAARARARAPGSPPRCAPPTWHCTARARPTASRSGAAGRLDRRAVRGAAGRGVLRRVDVQPRARRLQGRRWRAWSSVRSATGVAAHRLPAAVRATSRSLGASRASRGAQFAALLREHARLQPWTEMLRIA